MKKIKYFIKPYKYAFSITLFVGVLIIIVSSYITGNNSTFENNFEVWIQGCNFIDLFFPLIASIPFTWVLYFEKKNNYYDYAKIRFKKNKYLQHHILSSMFLSFLCIFFIYFISLLIVIFIFKIPLTRKSVYLIDELFGQIQYKTPIIFGFVWSIWKGLIASLFCLFGGILAKENKNFFVIALTPFAYAFIENFITGTIGKPQFSIYTSFILNRLDPIMMKTYYLSFGIIMMIIVLLITEACMRRRVIE